VGARKFKFMVLTKDSGSRLDAFLVRRRPARSRTQWAALIRAGQVRVDGKLAKPRHLLKRGQRVMGELFPEMLAAPVTAKLPIIYEDKDLLVINKPAGLVMHPAGRHRSGTLLNILEATFPEVYLVHRLDRDTSGVMVVACNLATKDYLADLFAKRLVHKTYLALLVGRVTPPRAYLNLPIRRGRTGKFEVGRGGRSAVSLYQVVEQLPGYSLAEVSPESGRTHQIRVHLAARHHPVAGDAVYGKKIPGLSRQFLHAFKIEFVDRHGRQRSFTAPLPPDLKHFLDDLRSR